LRWLVVQFAAKLLALQVELTEAKNGPRPAPLYRQISSESSWDMRSLARCGCRVVHTIEEARCRARKHGWSQILATDIRDALLNYQIATDQALQNAFQLDGPAARPAIVMGQPSIDPIQLRGTGQTYTGHLASPFRSESNLV
jgi:hypothetical protein